MFVNKLLLGPFPLFVLHPHWHVLLWREEGPQGEKKTTKGALARVNPYDFGGRKCFFFFVKKQDCLIRGSPLIFVLHGFNSQIMPKNHWYCSTSECVVISMLMSGYAVKQSNYWMMAAVRQLPYWVRVQLMSAEQLEYRHWVNEHFGKLRLTEKEKEKKDCLHSEYGRPKRTSTRRRVTLLYLRVHHFIFFVLSFS